MRFAVEGQLPQTFMAFVDSRLKANSFRESRHTTEEKRLGWVSAMDILDTDFNKDDYSLGDYLVFSLRADHKISQPNCSSPPDGSSRDDSWPARADTHRQSGR